LSDPVVLTQPRLGVDESTLVGLEADALVLTADERRWGRRRVRTRAGRELHLALPTGSRLTPGEILHVGSDWYVRIEAAREAVLAVRPSSFTEGVRLAFEVGNRHFTLAVDDGVLLVPDDPSMVQLFDRLGIAYERTRAPFAPLGFGLPH
jgi:urease accessory protein